MAAVSLGFSSLASEYEVKGKITQAIVSSNGNLISTNDFTVYVRDCGWLIETKEDDGSRVQQREVGSTNGTEIYEADGNRAFISDTGIPVELLDAGLVGHLWLMFASQCYWGSQHTDRLTPVYDWHASVGANPNLKIAAEWDLLNGPGSLPREVRYLGKWDETNGFYRITGTTNVGGMIIPTGFIFEERHVGPLAPDSFVHEMVLRKRVEAVVTSVKAVCSRKDLLPMIGSANTPIVDWRLKSPSSGNHIPTYKSHNAESWPSIAEAQAMVKTNEAAKAIVLQKISNRNQTGGHSKVVLIIMGIFLIGPPIIYLAWHKFRKS